MNGIPPGGIAAAQAAYTDWLSHQGEDERCDDCGRSDEHSDRCRFWLDELGGREQLAYEAQQRREKGAA